MGFENDNLSTNRIVNYDVYLYVIDSMKVKDKQIKK